MATRVGSVGVSFREAHICDGCAKMYSHARITHAHTHTHTHTHTHIETVEESKFNVEKCNIHEGNAIKETCDSLWKMLIPNMSCARADPHAHTRARTHTHTASTVKRPLPHVV